MESRKTVEFKESFNDEALEAIGAFSNARGGILLIGVEDSGRVCDFQIGKKTVEDIANRIQTVTDPRIQHRTAGKRNPPDDRRTRDCQSSSPKIHI